MIALFSVNKIRRGAIVPILIGWIIFIIIVNFDLLNDVDLYIFIGLIIMTILGTRKTIHINKEFVFRETYRANLYSMMYKPFNYFIFYFYVLASVIPFTTLSYYFSSNNFSVSADELSRFALTGLLLTFAGALTLGTERAFALPRIKSGKLAISSLETQTDKDI